MYRSSPFRSTLNTKVITALGMCKVCTEAVHSVALWTGTFRSSPFRSTWNTKAITALGMCKVCTEAVHSVALGTRTLSQLWACVKYVPKQSIPYSILKSAKMRKHANAKARKLENEWSTKTQKARKRRKRENTKTRKRENAKTRKLSMCPEALGTRTLSQLWACVKYVPKQSIPEHLWHERYHSFGHV